MGAWSTACNPFLGCQSHLTALQWPNKLLVLAKWQDETLPVTSGGASFPSSVATWVVVVFVIYTDFMTCCVLSVFPPSGVNNFMASAVRSRLNQRQPRDSLWTQAIKLGNSTKRNTCRIGWICHLHKVASLKINFVNSFLSALPFIHGKYIYAVNQSSSTFWMGYKSI